MQRRLNKERAIKRNGAAFAAAAAVFCGILAFEGESAFAGHPFGTEDAGTQGRGNVEVEFTLERVNGSDGSRTTTLGNAIAMGVAQKIDLAIDYAYDFEKDPEGVESRGMGPVELQLKTAVFEGNGAIPTFGIKGGASLPVDKGDQASILATAIAEWEFEPFMVFANAGADIETRLAGNDERATSLRASLAGAWEVREELYLLTELLWEKQTSPSASAAVEGLLGLKKEFSETFSVDAGIRWGLDDDAPDVTYLLGITMAFQGPAAPADAGR